MPETSPQDHFARAAQRHHDDAEYLHDGGRLPNADHHYGFAVECALKSLLLRHQHVSVAPTKPGGPPANVPWVVDGSGKRKQLRHLPDLWTDVALILHGRTGGILSGMLAGSSPFSGWAVEDRYLDCSDIIETEVDSRRTAARKILTLHQQAILAGVLP